jgi:hypothetical protein
MSIKRLLLFFGAALLAAGSLYFFTDSRTANGALAGVAIGGFNLAAITVTVKKIVTGRVAAPKAAAKGVSIFFAKIGLLAIMTAVVVVKKETFGIAGFISGFTLSVIIVLIEGWLSRPVKAGK